MVILNSASLILGATADYVSFAQSLPQADPISLLSALLLGLMRIAPIVSIVPFLGAKLPGPAKMGLALCIVAIFLPHLLVTLKAPTLNFDMNFVGYALKSCLLAGF